jgi:hypothetical protein
MEFYADPESRAFVGFSFDSPEEYDEKYARYFKKYRTEEYDIQFINGTNEEAAIANAARVSQGNLHKFFEIMDSMEAYRLPAFYYLLSNMGMDLEEAAEKVDELSFREGDAKAWAESFIDDMGGVGKLSKETQEQYFDYDSFAHDAEQNGDIDEFEFGGTTYTAEPQSV